ncbi:MAG: hypothetical protein QHC40_10945 [Sphingobium sp.]|nr:hypothetical protein [Sphingobium sp.]
MRAIFTRPGASHLPHTARPVRRGRATKTRGNQDAIHPYPWEARHLLHSGLSGLGKKKIIVKEFSTGTSDRDAAAHLMAEHETKLRHQLMFGPAALVAQGTIAQAFDSYLTKAKPPCASDILRIGKLNGLIGDFSLREPKQAWEHFRRAYLTGHDPAGQERYRAVFQAAINVYHELHDLPPLRIKAIPFNNERMRFLSKEDRTLTKPLRRLIN